MAVSWAPQIIGQLEFYMEVHLLPRLRGLTDEEYLWEPVEGAWSVRPDASGVLVAESAWPEPDPSPVTTIAWRMAHLTLGCFAERSALFFDDAPVPAIPATASGAVAEIERAYRAWHGHLAALDAEGFDAPLGKRGGPFAAEPMGALALHINREVMHHGGEIGALRDLYGAGLR